MMEKLPSAAFGYDGEVAVGVGDDAYLRALDAHGGAGQGLFVLIEDGAHDALLFDVLHFLHHRLVRTGLLRRGRQTACCGEQSEQEIG